MTQTTLQQLRDLAASGPYRTLPVSREIFSDIRTPLEVLRALKNVSRHCFLLESVEDSRQWGRYTFLGYDPAMELTCTDHRLTIRAGGTVEMKTEHPGTYLKQLAEQYRAPRVPGLPSFTGGLVGYFSYDYIKYSEPSLNLDGEDTEGFRDLDLMLFDKVIAFDNFRQKMILIANISAENLETGYNRALLSLDEMEKLVREGKPAPREPGRRKGEFRELFNREQYCRKVEEIKHYIREGDIFQLVLSNRLEAPFEGSLLDAYRVLRTTNPSPYMFYFSSDDLELAGASPETLVKVEDGEVRTFPLAGTRPRGGTHEEDQRLERELLSDEKELAEHNMLVDLGRNDLGKICEFGTVEVEKYQEIERFSHVMHIGSTVRGKLRKDKSPLDAVDAVLPAGTLSGAPKIRACQLINQLENNKRGIYGGAVGYLDFSGNLDTCIGIRLAFKKNGRVFIRSGAGIVADSVPEKEYQECVNKAKAVVLALKEGEEMEA